MSYTVFPSELTHTNPRKPSREYPGAHRRGSHRTGRSSLAFEDTEIRQHDPRRGKLRGIAAPPEWKHRYEVAALASGGGTVAATNVGRAVGCAELDSRGAGRSVPRPSEGASAPQRQAAVAARNGDSELDEILRSMISEGASDLHLSSDCAPVLRVDGEIRFLNDRGTFTSDRIEKLLLPIMTDDIRERFKTRRDADLAHEIPGLSRFRVNVFEDRNGVGTVIRQIPFDILTTEQLNLPKSVLDLCHLTKGLVVVTGPTGSGKSTTLAAMVDYINKNRSDHIITIEDPIEFVHKNQKCLMNQREVG